MPPSKSLRRQKIQWRQQARLLFERVGQCENAVNDPRCSRPTPELCDAISPHPGAAPLTFDPKQRSLMGSLKMLRDQRRCALYWMFLVLISVPASGPAAEEAPWPDPERYRAVIQDWAAGVPGPSRAVVGVGSSSMRFWSTSDRFAKAFEPLTTINRGFGGSVMNDVAYFLDPAVLDLEPRAVMIYEGDNDIARGISQAAIVSSLQGIIEQLHFRDPEIRVYVFSIKPSLARMSLWVSMQAVNQSFKSLAEGNDRVFYVDVATAMLNDNGRPDPDLFVDDGLHLSAAGYDVWQQVVREVVVPIETPFEGS